MDQVGILEKGSSLEIRRFLDHQKERVEAAMESLFLEESRAAYGRLAEGVRYSLLAGGKRIRPVLALATIEALGVDSDPLVPLVLPLELIHTYSLVHDDLPAMDNDDLRRGRPTNHVVYGEAAAILAGDALLTHAFTLLSDPVYDNILSASCRLSVIHELSVSAGIAGMVGGQFLDIDSEGKSLTLPELENLHSHKTGALLRASVRIGGFLAGAGEKEMAGLSRYGEAVGIAFQIADDLLDVEGTAAEMGKAIGKDAGKHKNTYPGLVGLEKARALAEEKRKEAHEAVALLGDRGEPLREIASYIIERRN